MAEVLTWHVCDIIILVLANMAFGDLWRICLHAEISGLELVYYLF